MFGPHVSRVLAGDEAPIDAHIAKAVAAARTAGVTIGAAQIFLGSPRAFKVSLTDDEMAALQRTDLELVAHGTFLDNPWSEKPFHKKAISFIREELGVCAAARIVGTVVHLPTSGDNRRVGHIIARILREPAPTTTLFLENSVGTPATYATPAEYAALVAALPSREGIGLCVDTAHLWGNGVNLADAAVVEEFCDGLDRLRMPVLWHLNDSLYPRGSGRDAHAALGRGEIWPAAEGAVHPALAALLWRVDAHKQIGIFETKPAEANTWNYEALLAAGIGRDAGDEKRRVSGGDGGGGGVSGGADEKNDGLRRYLEALEDPPDYWAPHDE